MEKFFGPFNKKTFKIDLDLMELFSRSLQFHYIEIRLYKLSIFLYPFQTPSQRGIEIKIPQTII
jgi:hypothetical protein